VICLDNLFTGSKRNIEHLIGKPGFEFVRHDVIDPYKAEVERIWNLACPASPVHYQYNPIKTVKTSVMGAINTLGLAKRVGARILQASTSEVYGDPKVHPQPEDYWGHVNPIGLRSCTKASAAPKPCSSTTTAKTRSTSAWCGFSTPTARAWRPRTAAWSAISSCRPCAANRSP